MSKITSIVLAMASALAKKHGLKLIIDPSAITCSTNGKNIVIPPIAKIMATQQGLNNLETYLIGAIIHEVGHVNFTKFDLIGNFRDAYKNDIANFVGNVIEDVVIERAQIKALPGGLLAISKLWSLLYSKRENHTETESVRMVQTEYIFHSARYSVLKSKESEALKDAFRERLVKELTQEWVDGFDAILAGLSQIATTEEGETLSRQILSYLGIKEAADNQQQQQQQQQQQESQDQQDQGDSNSAGGSAAGGDDGEGDSPSNAPSQTAPQQGANTNSDSDEELDIGSGDAFDMIAADMKDVLDESKDPSNGEMHMHIPGDEESSGSKSPQSSGAYKGSAKGRDLMNRILTTTMASRERLLDLLKSETVTHSRIGKKGKIVPSKLWKLQTGSMNVFRSVEERQAHSLCVKILLDRSGSTCDIIDVALEATCLLPLILDDVDGVKTSIDLFPYGNKATENFKHWNQRTQWAMQKLSMVDADGGTPLGEALIESAKDLNQEEGDRKIMIVVTDGQPDNFAHAKKVIHELTANDIEVIGVGIGVNLDRLFSRWVTCKSVQELSVRLQQILERDIRYQLAA